MERSGRVVGVVGARGGVGATTLAAALARRWVVHRSPTVARQRVRRGRAGRGSSGQGEPPRVALVDLDGAGAGLDVDLGIEAAGGVRWPDLSDARGEVPGPELAALLPTWCGVAVLSGDRWRPGPAPPDVVADVLDALVGCHHAVVLDVGRHEVLERGAALRGCDTALLVTTRDVRAVAGVVALRDRLRDAVPDVRLVVRGPAPGGLGTVEVAHAVDLPVAATLPVDRGLAVLVERGAGPVVAGRGALARCVDRLVADLAGPGTDPGSTT